MATMTADTRITTGSGNIVSYPMKASEICYKGQLISVVDGYGKPLVDGEKFAGVCIAKADNSSGSAGDISVECDIAMDRLVYLDNVNLYMVGAYVYAIDDNGDTGHTLAPMATPVGRVIQTDGCATDYAIIRYDINLCRENMGGVNGYFEPFRLAPCEGGVAANNTGVSLPWIRTSVNGPGIIDVIKAEQAYAYHAGLSIVPDTAENDGESLQIMGEPFLLDVTTRPVFFGAKVKVGVGGALASDLLFGLSITDTSILDGVTDGITWRSVDGNNDMKLYVEKDSTETASAATEGDLADSTAASYGFLYDGTNVYPYYNGVAGTGLAVTNLPDDEGLTPTIELIAGMATHLGVIVYFMDAYQIV